MVITFILCTQRELKKIIYENRLDLIEINYHSKGSRSPWELPFTNYSTLLSVEYAHNKKEPPVFPHIVFHSFENVL